MEILNGIYDFATNNSTLVLLGAVTLVEVAPIKVNPWGALLRWVGDTINGDLKADLSTLKKDFEENKADSMRWNILNFSRSCRNGEEHSEEEWGHVISQIKLYETLCDERSIENGVIEETSVYLRELYHKRLHKNDFL